MAVSRRRALGGGATWLGAALLTPRHAVAHPYHTTKAQARVEPRSMTLQVSLQVLPEDLEEALRRSTGTARRIEEVEDTALVTYLNRTMRWHHDLARDRHMPLRWVGKEVATHEVWLHFDYRLPSKAKSLGLEHRVFFELEDDQINTVSFGAGAHKRTLSLTKNRASATVAMADMVVG